MSGYVISSVRRSPAGLIVFGIVTDALERVNVTMPRRHTTFDEIVGTIEHALAARGSHPKPLGFP